MRTHEAGQAMLEGVLMLGTMALFIMAVGVIGRYGDLRMTTEHNLQYQLFDQARHPDQQLLGGGSLNKAAGVLAPWRDAHGALWLPEQQMPLHIQANIGELQAGWHSLADAWQASLRDTSMARLDVTQALRLAPGLRLGAVSRLPDFALQRSIYRGTGYALDEVHASSTLAASGPLWKHLQTRHASSFLASASRLSRIDAGWSRPAPGRDWLRPIEKWVPEDRLLRSMP